MVYCSKNFYNIPKEQWGSEMDDGVTDGSFFLEV